MVVHYVDSKGKHRIKGGADLKASENYPRLFLGSRKHWFRDPGIEKINKPCQLSERPCHSSFEDHNDLTSLLWS